MNIESLREYCLSKKTTTEGFPFDKGVVVYLPKKEREMLND